jgi:hypothetical protein
LMKLRVCGRQLASVAGLFGFATLIPGHAFGQLKSVSASVTLNANLVPKAIDRGTGHTHGASQLTLPL